MCNEKQLGSYLIDTRTLGSDALAYNFQVALPSYRFSKIRVKQMSLYNDQYTINANNKTLHFTSSATAYTATMTEGYYTQATFATALQTAMNAALAGFTCAYDSATKKITVSHATAFVLNFNKAPITNNLYYIMGATRADTSSATSYVGIMNTDWQNSVYVSIEELANLKRIDNTIYIPNLFETMNSGERLQTTLIDNEKNLYERAMCNAFSKITVKLYNFDTSYVLLNNTGYFQILLEFYE